MFPINFGNQFISNLELLFLAKTVKLQIFLMEKHSVHAIDKLFVFKLLNTQQKHYVIKDRKHFSFSDVRYAIVEAVTQKEFSLFLNKKRKPLMITLEIKSLPKQGTTVYVKIPYQPAKVKKHTKNGQLLDFSSSTDLPMPIKESCYILLVEDNELIRKITKDDLKILKHKVDTAERGADAIELALKNNYDLILLDISLPDTSGLEVMREIYKRRGDKEVFVGLTSHGSEEDEDYFIGQGMMAVLKKPVTRDQLKKCIESVMKAKPHMD